MNQAISKPEPVSLYSWNAANETNSDIKLVATILKTIIEITNLNRSVGDAEQ